MLRYFMRRICIEIFWFGWQGLSTSVHTKHSNFTSIQTITKSRLRMALVWKFVFLLIETDSFHFWQSFSFNYKFYGNWSHGQLMQKACLSFHMKSTVWSSHCPVSPVFETWLILMKACVLKFGLKLGVCSLPRSRSVSRHATLLPRERALRDETQNGCEGDWGVWG